MVNTREINDQKKTIFIFYYYLYSYKSLNNIIKYIYIFDSLLHNPFICYFN